jgi:hypothetical protein
MTPTYDGCDPSNNPEPLLDTRLNDLFLLLKHPLIKALKDQRLNNKSESLKITDLDI